MSIQPTQPVMDFDALVDLLEDRIMEYRYCRIMRRGAVGDGITDELARAAWGVHNAAAEIGKVTP